MASRREPLGQFPSTALANLIAEAIRDGLAAKWPDHPLPFIRRVPPRDLTGWDRTSRIHETRGSVSLNGSIGQRAVQAR